MAQDFERHIDRNTGTSPVTVHTSDSDDALIGIRLANVHASSSINVDVYITNTATDYYLIKSAPIPVGGSLDLIDGGAKIVIQSGDALKIVSDTASSLDSIVSRIDTISS